MNFSEGRDKLSTKDPAHTAQNRPGNVPGTSDQYHMDVQGLVNLRPDRVEVSAPA
jgi:hypothetical protein